MHRHGQQLGVVEYSLKTSAGGRGRGGGSLAALHLVSERMTFNSTP